MRRYKAPNYKAFFITMLVTAVLMGVMAGVGSIERSAKKNRSTVRTAQYAATPNRRYTPTPIVNYRYIGNRRSHVFHRPSCPSVKTMDSYNKVYFATREEAIQKDYIRCGRCYP